jgi:hypothetical protein
LIRLMVYVIKWKTQPARRSRSWVGTINAARSEIEDIREETPSLNEREIRRLWDRCIARALDEAKIEMNTEPAVRSLDWHDVFEAEYSIDDTPDTP